MRDLWLRTHSFFFWLLAKYVTDKTYTLCGTPLYIAPEVILNKGHDAGADRKSRKFSGMLMLGQPSNYWRDGSPGR